MRFFSLQRCSALSSAAVDAATLTVTTSNDSEPGSLRAVSAASARRRDVRRDRELSRHHVSTYAFNGTLNKYVYFFTTTANEGKTRSTW